jgi:hypothetical protein
MSEKIIFKRMEETEEEKALKAFLLDIDCLNKIDPWISKFNLFDVLKISRAEIRHSNMLGWLFDANESHGFNDLFIRGIMQRLVQTSLNSKIDVFKTLLMDFHSFETMREWKNIDLLILSKDEKFILCIENKVGSTEHDNQLKRYKQFIDEEYAGYTKMFVYLTPNGVEASDQNNWQTLSYVDIAEVLESCVDKVELIPDVKLLVENYIDVVRRDIVGDEKLVQICNEIYDKHKKALDLIYEMRSDTDSAVSEIFKKWCSKKNKEGLIIFNPKNSTKTITNFTTSKMDSIIYPTEVDEKIKEQKHLYCYHISNRDGGFRVFLELDIHYADNADKDRINKLFEVIEKYEKREVWRYKTIQTWQRFKLEEMEEEELEHYIFEKLDSTFLKVQKFEDLLIHKCKKG